MSSQPVVREYDHEPAPGVQAHTKEVSQIGDDNYKHSQKTTFEGPGGSHGVATEKTEVTVEHHGGAADAIDGKKHHHQHHSDHHHHTESSSHAKSGGLLSKIGKIFSSDKNKQDNGAEGDAARLTKYEGQEVDDSLRSSSTTVTGPPSVDMVESESSSVVKQEIPTPKKVDRAADQYATSETSQSQYGVSSATKSTGQSVQTTEQKTTKTTTTVMGRVLEERNVHADLSQRINDAKRMEQREEDSLVERVDNVRIGALQRESSAPYARNVDIQKEQVNIDVRRDTQMSDMAAPPYVVERPGSHQTTDATYRSDVSNLATGPTVVENQPQQSTLINEQYRTQDIASGPYVVESQSQSSGLLNESMRTQDLARGPSMVENRPQQSGLISERQVTSDIAAGPYVVESHGQRSGLINEQTKNITTTGPSVVENRPQQSNLISERLMTSQIATGPSVVENRPSHSNLLSERVETSQVAQGPYLVESRGHESGLVSERDRTRDVAQGPYLVESRGIESGLASEQYKTRDRAVGPAVVENRPSHSNLLSERVETSQVAQGPYVVESRGQQSGLVSERHATSDIAAGPYFSVKEGEHANVDASSREAASHLAGRDVYARNEHLPGVNTVTQKFENYEDRMPEKAPIQIVKEASLGQRVDQFEHEQMSEITKTVKEIPITKSVEHVKSQLMTESPIQKTPVPDLHAHVAQKTHQIESYESVVETDVPQQIPIEKHRPIGGVLDELREHAVARVEKTVPPRLETHVADRAVEMESVRREEVTSSPIELVKHASIGGVLEELRESAVTYVEKTPAPIIQSNVPLRAEQLQQQQQCETVSIKRAPVELGNRVDIGQIKESLATKEETMKMSEAPQVQSNVRESVSKYERTTPAEQSEQRFQREVSARGDVHATLDKFQQSNRDETVTSKNVVEVTERGTVREQKALFESGQAYNTTSDKSKLVLSSQPVEIAQVEVERVEQIKTKDRNGSKTVSSGTTGDKSTTREDVTVKINKNLEGMRVVPEKVIVQKEQHVTRTETVAVKQQSGNGGSGGVNAASVSSDLAASANSSSAKTAKQVAEVKHESVSTTKTQY